MSICGAILTALSAAPVMAQSVPGYDPADGALQAAQEARQNADAADEAANQALSLGNDDDAIDAQSYAWKADRAADDAAQSAEHAIGSELSDPYKIGVQDDAAQAEDDANESSADAEAAQGDGY